jgi:putative ABC transport system permease protein
LTNLARDVLYGLRLLGKTPGFTIVAALTLALGIAADTAIFSVVYGVFLAPLPYHEAERLVTVFTRGPDGDRLLTDASDFAEWRRRAAVFEDLNAWSLRSVNLASGDRPEHVEAAVATPRLLAMMGYGQPLALGRDFLDEEGAIGRDQVAVLSHRLWRTRFGGDLGVVGRPIRIDGRPYTVIGVLGAGPADRNVARLWLPAAFTPEELKPEVKDLRWYVMGRLKPQVTVEQAQADMVGVARQLADSAPAPHGSPAPHGRTRWSASVEPLRTSFLAQDTKTVLWLLLGAVTFVLLVACVNVANLLLARGTARRRELAVRASLGASRATLVRQLVTESGVLALLGGSLGVALAWALLGVVVALVPAGTLPSEAEVRLNLPVLLFTLVTCLLCGIVFGGAPAWRAARANVSEGLKDAASSLAHGRDRLRRALVVAEFALALTLLAGGGLAVLGLIKLTMVDLGFRHEGLLTFSLPVPRGRLTGAEEIDTFYRELVDRVQAIPGVRSASVSGTMPVQTFGFAMWHFDVVGRHPMDASERPAVRLNTVSPGYFATFGIPIKRGRAFTDQDRAGGRRVAIVNEVFVRRFASTADLPTLSLTMESLMPGSKRGPPVEWQVVGVCGDVRNADLRSESEPEIILPFGQSPWPETKMAVRTAADTTDARRSVAEAIRSLDPELPMADVKTMDEVVRESMAGDRWSALLFGGFAAVALLLAAVGIYGVMSFAVAQRTREIGLRMALGAGRAHVLREVAREGMTAALLGTALGSAGAWLVGRLMRGMLYGVGGMDPTTFGVVALILLGAAFLACLAPARRAASVDPMVALREE